MLGKVNLIKLKLKMSVKSPLMLHSSNASRNKQNLRSLLPKSFLRKLRLDFTEYQTQNLHIKRWEILQNQAVLATFSLHSIKNYCRRNFIASSDADGEWTLVDLQAHNQK